MVALSSSSSSSSSSSDQSDPLPSLDEILADPQRHFPRFLFDSDPLAVMELLNTMLYRSADRGHPAAIECLWCWQDLTDSTHSLSPLLDELRTAQDAKVAVAGLRLLIRLLQFAPDRVRRARLRNEMDELRLDELVLTLRDRFGANPELDEPIGDWMRARAAAEAEDKPAEEGGGGRADADSGTFSGEEMEESGGGVKRRSISVDGMGGGQCCWEERLIRCGVGDLAESERDQLIELVKQLATLGHNRVDGTTSFGQTLRAIRAILAADQNAVGASGPSHPPPPPPLPPPLLHHHPPPLQSDQPSSSAGTTIPPGTIIQKPPVPPPPPPVKKAAPLAAFSAASSAADVGPSAGGPTPSADIPRHLRPKALPSEGRRLRHLQWTKVPANAVMAAAGTSIATGGQGGMNIWHGMEMVDRELRDRLDFAQLDTLFGCPTSPTSAGAGAGMDAGGGGGHQRRRSSMAPNQQHQRDCISLLGPRRSLSVNVFLKMCRDTAQLLKDLAAGQAASIGADRLRTLAQLLPSEDEQKALREFAGDPSTLGQAEQFLLALITRIPEYRLRLEAMLFRLDLDGMKASGTGLEPWLKGAEELMSSSCLRKVLYILLHLGNYLNHGAGAGNACGFRLASLWKVEDVKAFGGKGRTLLHFVAQQAGNCAAEDELVGQLGNVREATKSSLEAIRDDLKGLVERMRRLEGLIAAANREKEERDAFFTEFCHFLEESHPMINMAEGQLARLDLLRPRLAAFFCESERAFSVEDCFKVVNSFVTRFGKAVEENRQKEDRNGGAAEEGAAKNGGTLKLGDAGNAANGGNLTAAAPRLNDTAGKRGPAPRREGARRSAGFLPERERTTQNGAEQPMAGGNERRRTLATAIGGGKIVGERGKEKASLDSARQNWPVSSGQADDNLETIVNLALVQGCHPKKAEERQRHEMVRNNSVEQPNQPGTQASALIAISDGAKGCLAAGGAATAKKNGPSGGGVAKKIDQYEGKMTAPVMAQAPRGAQRLSQLARVRSIHGNAIVQLGAAANQPVARPSPLLRRQQTMGTMGTMGTTTSRMAIAKIAESAGGKVAATGEKSPAPLQRAKSVQSPSAKVPSSVWSPVGQKVPTAAQGGTPKPPIVTTPKGTKPKATLTRQVSTASRPALVNSGSCEKKPKWV